MHRVAAIAFNTFREAVRDRILYSLIAFALLLIGTAVLFGEISIGIQTLILINMGLSAVTFFGLAIAIFIGIGLVYKEMDKRTLYALLAKPVRRYEFILGKYAGLGLTLLVNTTLMAAGFFAALWYVRGALVGADGWLLVALCFIFLQLLLVTALALFFSTFSSPVLSAGFTFGLFLVGSFSADLLELSAAVQAPWLEGLMKGIYYAVPNFRNFNVVTTVAHGQGIPLDLVLYNSVYAFLYIGLAVGVSTQVFERRNLK